MVDFQDDSDSESEIDNYSCHIVERFKYLQDTLSSPTPLENAAWSDIRLKEMSQKYKFDMNEWDPKTAKIILTRFFNFYFTGKIPSEDNLIATVHDCISLAHVNGRRLFNPRLTGKIYYIKNASVPTSVTSEIMGISKRKTVPYKLSAFHNYIKKAVDEFNTTSITNISDKELLGLTGFLALTLCKSATRDKNHIIETFEEAQYRNTLESVAEWPSYKPFARPVEKALNLCSTVLKKTAPSTQALFCILVDEMVKTHAPDYPEPKNKLYLGNSVLFHTGYSGLAMIKMLIDVCELLETSWKNIRPLLLYQQTNISCRRIDKFIESDLKDGEHGFPWARIIHNDFLSELSLNNNKNLCLMMTAIIEYKKGLIVWQEKWIQGRIASYSDIRKSANAIYQIRKMIKTKKLADCGHILTFCTCNPPSSKKIKLMKYLVVQIEKNNISEIKRILESVSSSSKTSKEQPE